MPNRLDTDNSTRDPRHPLIVGCWPGRSFAWNSFPAIFCDAIEAAGCTVVEIDDPLSLTSRLDVLHIHWPEQIFWRGGNAARLAVRTLRVLWALGRLRRSGTRLVWMVHNLQPHDLEGARRLIWSRFATRLAILVDGVMTLSPATLPAVLAALPQLGGKPAATPWHPAYVDLPDVGDRATCRSAIGLPDTARVFAFLGLIRPYKGVEELVRAFRGQSDTNDRLIIAGSPDTPEYGAAIKSLAAGDPRIDIRLGRLSDVQMAEFATASDTIVLPFRDYLHSGSIIYALSLARPVITPAMPFAEALGSAVGSGWVQVFHGELTPEILGSTRAMNSTPDLSPLDPALLGQAATSLFRSLVR